MRFQRVAIIGAGTMGRRIAFTTLANFRATTLYDTSGDARRDAPGAIERLLAECEKRGVLPSGATRNALGHLTISSALDDCVARADVVIECVPERVELKREVFAALDREAPPAAVLATNSSAIPGSWLADATLRPSQVVNCNFGTADDVKVEVMPHPGTSQETLEAMLDFLRGLGLVPLLVRKEIVGYAGNRVWRSIKKEVLELIAGGHATAEDIDRGWMLDWGVAIGPCGLMDRVGLDVVRDIEMIYFRASGDPADRPPQFLEAMIQRGELGEKAGRGFYTYPDPAYADPRWLTRTDS